MVWNGTNFDTLGKIQLIVIEKLVKTQDPLVSESIGYTLLRPHWFRVEKMVHFFHLILFKLPLAYFSNGSFHHNCVQLNWAQTTLLLWNCLTAWTRGQTFSHTDWLWHKSWIIE